MIGKALLSGIVALTVGVGAPVLATAPTTPTSAAATTTTPTTTTPTTTTPTTTTPTTTTTAPATTAPITPTTTATTVAVSRLPATVKLDLWPRNAQLSLIPPSASGPIGASIGAQGTMRTSSGPWRANVTAPGFQLLSTDVVIAPGASTLHLRLDPNGQLHRHLADADTGSNPKQVAFTPDGTQLWVPLLGSRGVDVFSASDGRKITTIGLGNGKGAVEVIFNRTGTRAYVSQMETASVYEIDTAKRTVLRRMGTGGNWTKVLALSPDEQTLYAANWVSNDVSVINLATGRLIERIATVTTPRGLALDSTGTRLFVAGFEGGEIQRINLATKDKVVLLRTGGAMRHMVVDPTKNVLYADDMGTSGVYVVDLATEKVRLLTTVDSHPNTIDLSPDGKYLFVSNRGDNNAAGYNIPGPEWGSVLVIDTTTGAPVDAIIGGNQTTGLDVSPDGTLLAFTDFLDNRLALYRIPSAAQLAGGGGGLAPTRRALIVKRAK